MNTSSDYKRISQQAANDRLTAEMSERATVRAVCPECVDIAVHEECRAINRREREERIRFAKLGEAQALASIRNEQRVMPL